VFLTKVFDMAAANPLTSQIPRNAIISAGATHLDRLTNNPVALGALRSMYSEAIKDTMIVALVAVCLSLLCLPGMEWLKLENEQTPSEREEKDRTSLKSCEETV
jgi:hypothetical protein